MHIWAHLHSCVMFEFSHIHATVFVLGGKKKVWSPGYSNSGDAASNNDAANTFVNSFTFTLLRSVCQRWVHSKGCNCRHLNIVAAYILRESQLEQKDK